MMPSYWRQRLEQPCLPMQRWSRLPVCSPAYGGASYSSVITSVLWCWAVLCTASYTEVRLHDARLRDVSQSQLLVETGKEGRGWISGWMDRLTEVWKKLYHTHGSSYCPQVPDN